jgi:nitroreductase
MNPDFETLEKTMRLQRAVRLFTNDPVDDELVARLIRTATFAPSGGNRQPWRFIVIRDRGTKAALGKVFDELGAQLYGPNAPERTPWGDVPVLIAVISEARAPAPGEAMGSSIYPVVQNLLLAIHGAGLGSVLTTRWKAREADVRPLLGLDEKMDVHAILPVGWPTRKYGRGKRLPVAEITSREKYGQPW